MIYSEKWSVWFGGLVGNSCKDIPVHAHTHTQWKNLIALQCFKSSICLRDICVQARTPSHPQEKCTHTQQLTYDAITHKHKMGCDTHLTHTCSVVSARVPLLLPVLCVGFLLRLQLNSICHSEKKSECVRRRWGGGGGGGRVYMKSKVSKALVNAFICVSTSKGVFTDTRERAQQQGDLNVILTNINPMYHTVHISVFCINYFRSMIVDDMPSTQCCCRVQTSVDVLLYFCR